MNETIKILKEYPDNLINDIYKWHEDHFKGALDTKPDITDDVRIGLNIALSYLTEEEENVLLLHYKYGLTFPNISKIYNLCASRIYQIRNKALMKLCHPSRRIFIENGFEKYVDMRIEKEKKHIYTIINKNTDIYELDLFVSTHLKLKISNINTISELVSLSENEISKIRNFTNMDIKEVKEKLNESGITGTVWDTYTY